MLVDHSDDLLRDSRKAIEWRDETIASLRTAERWHEELIANQKKTIGSQEEAVKWRGNQIEELNKGLEWFQKQLADMKEKSASDEKALEWRAGQVETLEKERTDLIAALQSTQRQFNLASEQLEAIYASSGWKFILRIRYLRDRLRRLTGLGKSPGQQ